MQFTLLMVAVGLIATSATQLITSSLNAWRTHRRTNSDRLRRLDKHRSAAQIARLSSQLDISTGPKTGCQWRVLEVAKVVAESVDAKSFYLADPYDQALPLFHPGQYLMVRPALAGAYQATRCYSLSVAPNPKLWRITVKWQETETPPRADRKTGALSQWLHETIRDGDCLLVGGPSGHFFLSPDNTSPLVLLAAGVGITPMNSMLQHSLLKTPTRPVHLYYQVRDLDHWPLGREVHACCEGSSGEVRVVTYLSRTTQETMDSTSSNVLGKTPGEFREGRIDIQAVVAESVSSDTHYFMCGPDAWMEAMRTQLFAAGVREDQVHWESFGGGAPGLGESTENAAAHSVCFQRSKAVATWESPEQSLWELAQANDVLIPSGCLSGVCGSCRVNVLQGSVEYDRKIGISLAADECLACVARPKEDLIIDA